MTSSSSAVPIGGYFVWDVEMGGPLLLIAGGSGVCPLMAMLRHRAARGSHVPTRLLYSARTLDDIIYRVELGQRAVERRDRRPIRIHASRPHDWHGYRPRIDRTIIRGSRLGTCRAPARLRLRAHGLRRNGLEALVDQGHDPDRIKTERFGVTGSP